MNRIFLYICGLLVLGAATSCKKNDPITELGTTNGEFAATLRVSYNNTRPAIDDTLIVTASVSQRDDRFDKVVFSETVFETFGIDLQLLKGTAIKTREETFSTLLVTDTIKTKTPWKEVTRAQLDDYWVTVSNNYVIRADYEVKQASGQYPNDVTLVGKLPDNEFAVLKGILAYSITKDDYLSLFPGSPATHFTTSGTYALTALGMENLRTNLTKAALLPIVKSTVKIGLYSVKIDVDAITPTGATTSTTRTFDNNL
jgi:hypothetical protein